MFDLQMQMLSALSETARFYGEAYKATIAAQWSWLDAGAAPDPAQNPPEPQRPDAAWAAMFDVPSHGQQSTQSWYRAPVENPILAFWDDALRPWRTYTSRAWPAPVPPFAAPVDPTAMMSNITAAWMQALDTHATAMQTAVSTAGDGSASKRAPQSDQGTALRAMPGFAVAHILFPDETEMTITIPCPMPGFAFPR